VAATIGARRRPLRTGDLVAYLLLIIGATVALFPFLWMIATAFKPGPEIYNLKLLPANATLANFQTVWRETLFGYWFENSFLIATVTTVSVLFFDSLVGYVLAKIHFRGRDVILFIFLSSIMIPTEMLIIPWYIMSVKLGWVDTFWGAMFPGMITAFGIFLMRQFMVQVPGDLLDAGRIDGLNEFQLWWRIAVPLTRPAMAALAILTFLGSWNAFLWPVIVLSSPQMLTIPVGLTFFSYEAGTQWELIMASSSIAVIPVLIVFMIFQKQIIEGIALTGIK
jgi:multiple sugar transport system permease protein